MSSHRWGSDLVLRSSSSVARLAAPSDLGRGKKPLQAAAGHGVFPRPVSDSDSTSVWSFLCLTPGHAPWSWTGSIKTWKSTEMLNGHDGPGEKSIGRGYSRVDAGVEFVASHDCDVWPSREQLAFWFLSWFFFLVLFFLFCFCLALS